MITAPTPTATARPGTRALLACAVVAGPLWAGVSLAQVVGREGFDLTRHPLSALSNGDLGWLQIANFAVAGVLAVAGAIGLRRALAGAPGGVWAPRLVAIYGIGMIAAGAFVMEPADGFPVGTPEGTPTALGWTSFAHMAAGSLTFIALIAVCYVLARRFARTGDRARSVLSVIAGTALLLGDGWAMTGGALGSLTLAVGAITAMLWVSAVAAHHLRTA
ncbi:DUF998 domain-containing protein [Nocardiopsis sp. N85]|uniref:DUF998 domain-containing protein n=1 Tax=Nocardiopsis sp. N85 TaxID=3029400 RepID=UPI00237F1FCE|nr:DUF998 domain-containing protein [Nocardiopsis sp. N85]MDE3720229.1 DUF998 domain-containing protein [Nocardiopsis sp. N85]